MKSHAAQALMFPNGWFVRNSGDSCSWFSRKGCFDCFPTGVGAATTCLGMRFKPTHVSERSSSQGAARHRRSLRVGRTASDPRLSAGICRDCPGIQFLPAQAVSTTPSVLHVRCHDDRLSAIEVSFSYQEVLPLSMFDRPRSISL